MECILLNLYLNRGDAGTLPAPGGKFYQVWKWFPDYVINGLHKEGLISIYSESIALTNEGLMKAQELKYKYQL
ncbi:MAG TPA: DUF6429 family protein [Candidatus Kapabacteria bacterium]|nr:DUF6429 family protein [Candidatus Kapabacteria bacterium]